MAGRVWVSAWDDPEVILEAVRVSLAPNGIVEVEVRRPGTDVTATGAWWRWKSRSADDLYGYIDELATLPGWTGGLRATIFENLEDRRWGRVLRKQATKTGLRLPNKGSVRQRVQ